MRDPLQHLLPLISTRPDLARSVIRLSIKQMQASAYTLDPEHPTLLPDSLIGSGVARSGRKGAPEPDDFELYLLLAASEYVLSTKDATFLSEHVHSYNTSRTKPLVEHLVRAVDFVIDTVGRGPHGLLRLLSSDWCAKPAAHLKALTLEHACSTHTRSRAPMSADAFTESTHVPCPCSCP